ncbi:MAG: hypothetical protein ACREQI_16795 [Candidatus Binataceae bacterium]
MRLRAANRFKLRTIALTIAALCLASCHAPPAAPSPSSAGAIDLLTPRNPAAIAPHSFRPPWWMPFGAPNASRLSAPKGAPPEIEIDNPAPAMAGMRRLFSISPGSWYRFSVEIRTDRVSQAGQGARLRVEVREGMTLPTPSLHGTTGWKPISFYYRLGNLDPATSGSMMIFCELGAFGQLSSGKAYFRNLQVAPIEGRPPPIAARFDGGKLETDPALQLRRHPAGLQTVLLLLLLLGCAIAAAIGWRLMSPPADRANR